MPIQFCSCSTTTTTASWALTFRVNTQFRPPTTTNLLDQLNLTFNLNLNQVRGPYQLSWTLNFRVSTHFRQPTTTVLLDQLNPSLNLNINQVRGPYKLSWALTFYWINSTSTRPIQAALVEDEVKA